MDKKEMIENLKRLKAECGCKYGTCWVCDFAERSISALQSVKLVPMDSVVLTKDEAIWAKGMCNDSLIVSCPADNHKECTNPSCSKTVKLIDEINCQLSVMEVK